MARDYAKEYQRRMELRDIRGISTSQARGHPSKHEKPLREIIKEATRRDVDISRVNPFRTKTETFKQSNTKRDTFTVKKLDKKTLDRAIKSLDPDKGVGVSIRVNLKDGTTKQTDTFGTASMGMSMYAAIEEGSEGSAGFDEDDVDDFDIFSTELDEYDDFDLSDIDYDMGDDFDYGDE